MNANFKPQASHNRLPVLASEIKASLADVRRHHAATLASAVEAGERLLEAKALLGHGQWMPWLKEHCEMSSRTARDYMHLAEHKDQIGSAATIRAALEAVANEVDPLQDSGRWAEPVSRVGRLTTSMTHHMLFAVPSLVHSGCYWASYLHMPTDADRYMDVEIIDLKKPILAQALDFSLRRWLSLAPGGGDYEQVVWREYPRDQVDGLMPGNVVPENEVWR